MIRHHPFFTPLLFLCLASSCIAVVFFFHPWTAHSEGEETQWKQTWYRWYVNTNGLTPTDPWPVGPEDLGENQAITLGDEPPRPEAIQRLRVSAELLSGTSVLGERFILQFSQGQTCSILTNWTNVGAPGSEALWRGFDNTASAALDDASLPSALLSLTTHAQTYEEDGLTAATPQYMDAGDTAEWDFVLQNHNAPYDTPYCFRLVRPDGTQLTYYDDYPLGFTDAPYTPKSQNWRWYGTASVETPSSTDALGAENATTTLADPGQTIKLRLTVKETAGGPGTNIKMKLQFSTDPTFASGVTELAPTSTCATTSTWCYGDGVDVDDDIITTRLLSDSDASGRHNESASTTSSYDPVANEATEWEFTLRNNGAPAGRRYYFRAYDVTNNVAVPLNTGEDYPQIEIRQVIDFTVQGVSFGQLWEGVTTTVTTTSSSVPFGLLSTGVTSIGAHRLFVTTSAPYGYSVDIRLGDAFQNANGDVMGAHTGTNASPSAWPTSVTSTSALGYHTSDEALSSGVTTRFALDDTYAAFTTSTEEIIYTGGVVYNDAHTLVYKVAPGSLQPAGTYSSAIVFVVTPTF